MIMGRAASPHRSPFQVDEEAALAELEQAWTSGGYHGFSADGGTWCAITSAGQVLTGSTPDELARAIRAHWLALQ
jgi:hypothetical protein